MSLYVPEHFRSADSAAAHDLIEGHPLCLLVSVEEGTPRFSPVPVFLDRDHGALGRLRFHLARANPQSVRLAERSEASLVFHGPETYVSPDWYVDTKLPPTWNYELVIAHGRATPLDDDGLLRLLADLSHDQERRLDKVPWTMEKMGEDSVRGLLRGILGFAFEIDRLEAKSKLSQNRSPADRASVRRALAAQPGQRAHEVAARMAAVDPDHDA